jgi:putative peptide zinc metalloprotease protein
VTRAHTDGVFVAPEMVDMPERYYRKGELMGYVLGKARPLARVVVPQEAVDKVRLATDRVQVRLSESPLPVLEGRVVREVPAGDETLPSTALASQGGGEIATDPREAKVPKALRRVFQFDVELDGTDRLDYFGQRVYVRFEHEREPLLVQWYRSIRLLFLTSFYV